MSFFYVAFSEVSFSQRTTASRQVRLGLIPIDDDLLYLAAISNQCGRLIANVVIAYNSMLLSGQLGRYLATGNENAVFDVVNFGSSVAAPAFSWALRIPRYAATDSLGGRIGRD